MFRTKVVEKIKTRILFSIFENHAVYEIMWKNIRGKYGACWITKATHTRARAHTHTHTHSEYVILIAFPLQHMLHERASMLRYTHITCFVYFSSHLCALSELGLYSLSIGNNTREKFLTNVRKYLLLIKEHVSKVLFHFWK